MIFHNQMHAKDLRHIVVKKLDFISIGSMPFTNDRVIKLRYMGFLDFYHLKVIFRYSFCLLNCCFLLSFANIIAVKRCRRNEGSRAIKYEISITEYYFAIRAKKIAAIAMLCLDAGRGI